MRALIVVALLASLAALATEHPTATPAATLLAAKCVGADPCLACKNCENCQHCKGGRTCGTCKPKKDSRQLAFFGDPTCRSAEPTAWRVVSVHDGDTLTAVDAANVQHKVRLTGIDAPEIGQR